MNNCSETFKKIFTTMEKEGAFAPFLPIDTEATIDTIENVDKIMEDIAIKALTMSNSLEKSVSFYDFKGATEKLESLRDKKSYSFLTDDVINTILDNIKSDLNVDLYAINPLIENSNGVKSPLFDFNDLSKLTNGIESMTQFIDVELNNGLFKIIFINTIEEDKNSNSGNYVPFVVTDEDLNNNIKVYKSKLWEYIVSTMKLKAPPLYIGGVLNKELFLPRDNKPSRYVEIMSKLKEEMEIRLNSSERAKNIRVYNAHGNSYAQAYLKSLILANFDEFILTKHSNKVVLNRNSASTFLTPTNGENKYKLTFSWAKTASIDNDEYTSGIEDNTPSLIHMLSAVIPYYSKEIVNGKEKWKVTREYTIGKNNLDSIGAVLNSINPNLKINITVGEETKAMSIATAFIGYDAGILSFENILAAIIKAAPENDELLFREAILRSLHGFLYSKKNGLKKKLDAWKWDHPNLADKIINPEYALINHIRNTVRNIYRKETLDQNGKSIDVLNIESKVGKDFTELFTNLHKAWAINAVTIADLDSIVDYAGFFDFLTHPKKGGLTLSNKTKENFIHNVAIDFSSAKFKEHMLKLLSLKASGLEAILTEGGLDYESLPTDHIINKINSKEVNTHLKLKELFKYKHYTSKYSIITQIKDSQGNFIPTMGISNLASQFNTALVSNGKNFFTDNPDLYKGMETLLEIVGENDSVYVNDLNSNELFKLSFIRHYLMSTVNENRILVQPWNFSDKPKIFALKINTLGILDKEKKWADFTSEDFKQQFFEKQQSYYVGLVDTMLVDMKVLDPKFFKSHQKNNKMNSAIQKVAAMEAYFATISSRSDLFDKINDAFTKTKEHFEIVEDLHYSTYSEGKKKIIKFNQFLKGNVLIFNNKNLFDKYVKSKEDSLLKSLPNINAREISFGKVQLNKKKELLAENFGIKENEIFNENNMLITNVNGKLTELVSRYLWSRNLIISQYTNLTVKDSFLHPSKMDFQSIDLDSEESWAQFVEEESSRTTTFTKRMNAPGASMTVYGKGKEGISPKIKIIAIAEPSAPTFNYTGESHSQDVADGGAEVNAFFNNLLISSLPGLNLQKTQKPIGESIKKQSASMLKFASFAITNEKVRKGMFSSRGSYVAMQKMNSLSLYENNNYKDILEIDGGSVNINEIQDNLYVPVKGRYYKLDNMKWVKGTNQYVQTLSWGGKSIERTVIVNNLFDLWEAFGGARSAKRVQDDFIYTEASIDLVSSIIKLHSIADTDFHIKDKMIAMLVPQSAIKKGAANINNIKTLYETEKDPSYFEFDASYFGVQLTAFHSTDDSTTNEITQVISSIAQNGAVPELYNMAYGAISSLIENALEKFNLDMAQEKGIQELTGKFIKHINKSEQINNSRLIIDGIIEDSENLIPYSNKTIYKQFISYIISNINVDFIRRTFAGSGSILNPSHDIVEIFEDSSGKTYFAEDLLPMYQKRPLAEKQAFELTLPENISEFKLAKLQISFELSNNSLFVDQNITIKQLQPVDSVRVNFNFKDFKAGEVILLETKENFFALKEAIKKHPEAQVTRVFGNGRNLRPVLINFETELNGKESIYNTDAFAFNYWIEANQESLIKTELVTKNKMFNKFREYIQEIDPFILEVDKDGNSIFTIEEKLNILQKYATRWMSRTFDLLNNKKILARYDGEQEFPFHTMFAYTVKQEGKKDIYVYDDFTSRYEENREYKDEQEVTKYVHKQAENIHSNVQQTNFGIKNIAHSKVSQSAFFNSLSKFANVYPKRNTPWEVRLGSSSSDTFLHILIGEDNYYEKKGKLYSQKNGEEVGEKIEVYGDETRVDNFGKKMYKLPLNYSIFKDKRGVEIILIKEYSQILKDNTIKNYSSIDVYKRFVSNLANINVIDFQDMLNHAENIQMTDTSDSLLSLLSVTIDSIHNVQLRKFLRDKRRNYKNFKKANYTLSPEQLTGNYINYLKTIDKDNKLAYITRAATASYKSWQLSNVSLSARIPAQALQSFMSMNTVGYIEGDANDIFVSHWQLWLQGSDFDIDKLYMMMYEFKNSLFQGWSPYFDVLNLEKSFEIPLPNNRKYKHISEDGKVVHIVETSYKKDENGKLETKRTVIIPTTDNTLDLRKEYNPKISYLNNRIQILKVLADKPEIKYLIAQDDGLIKNINYHNSYMSEAGFKNFIVHKLLEVSDNPKNQVASYSPISFGVYEKIKKRLGDRYKMSNYDGNTTFKQQEQNAVGKKVIGIAATGLKDYFALVRYFGEYYKDVNEIDPSHNAYFLRAFTINGKEYVKGKIAGLNVTTKSNELLKEHLSKILKTDTYKNRYTGKEITEAEINTIIEKIIRITPDEDAALTISSILSLATDNAKELMLAKINAGIDFASMHLYLAIMGVSTEDVTEFMTDKNVELIKKKMERDFFATGKNNSPITRLNKIDPNKIGVNEKFFNEFMKIQKYSSELTSLGKMFKVNQGSKATQEDLYTLSNTLQTILATQDLQYFSTFEENEESGLSILEQKVDFILQEKPYLKESEENENYVTTTLENAEKLFSKVNSKEIDVIEYYTNDIYKNIIKDYYNIIKYTFNVFDVLDNSPHFNSMFKAFMYGEKILLDNVLKYKFLKKGAPEIIDFGIKNKELDNNNIIRQVKLLYNKKNPISFSNTTLNKLNNYYDYKVISEFTKTIDKKINLSKLMDYLSITSINLLRNDKSSVLEDAYTKDSLPYTDIDLSTEFGLAQFRYLMENYIIQEEKNKHRSNGFLQNYTYSATGNFNLKYKLSHYLDTSNYQDLEDLQIGMSLLINSNGNKTDEDNSNYKLPIEINEEGNVNNIDLLDLLTLYDLIINEGRFGGNRATRFFAKDIKNPNSIARQFINFQNNFDHNEDNLKNMINELSDKDNIESNADALDKRDIFYLLTFGNYNVKEHLTYVKLTEERSISVNKYFNILRTMSTAIINNTKESLVSKLIKQIKIKNINIEAHCD